MDTPELPDLTPRRLAGMAGGTASVDPGGFRMRFSAKRGVSAVLRPAGGLT